MIKFKRDYFSHGYCFTFSVLHRDFKLFIFFVSNGSFYLKIHHSRLKKWAELISACRPWSKNASCLSSLSIACINTNNDNIRYNEYTATDLRRKCDKYNCQLYLRRCLKRYITVSRFGDGRLLISVRRLKVFSCFELFSKNDKCQLTWLTVYKLFAFSLSIAENKIIYRNYKHQKGTFCTISEIIQSKAQMPPHERVTWTENLMQ